MSLPQMRQQIENLETVVFGNGSKGSGLKSMVEAHDYILGEVVKTREEYRRNKNQVIVAVVISVAIAAGSYFWTAGQMRAAGQLMERASQKMDSTAQEIEASSQ